MRRHGWTVVGVGVVSLMGGRAFFKGGALLWWMVKEVGVGGRRDNGKNSARRASTKVH